MAMIIVCERRCNSLGEKKEMEKFFLSLSPPTLPLSSLSTRASSSAPRSHSPPLSRLSRPGWRLRSRPPSGPHLQRASSRLRRSIRGPCRTTRRGCAAGGRGSPPGVVVVVVEKSFCLGVYFLREKKRRKKKKQERERKKKPKTPEEEEEEKRLTAAAPASTAAHAAIAIPHAPRSEAPLPSHA